jgi:hypothetical protein
MNTEYIESLILRLCKQPRSYEYISGNLFGLDPLDLTEILVKMKDENKIKMIHNLWVINNHKRSGKDKFKSLTSDLFNSHIHFFNLDKKPHPLDFEWRNATSTVNYLTKLILDISATEDKILLLGMPTLFANLIATNIPNSVTLVDNNKALIVELKKKISDKRFKILEGNLFKITTNEIGKHSVVFMDPPWYTSFYHQFIWVASGCIEMGGTLGISLPAMNTRPNVDKERLEWFTFCLKHGLVLENLYAQRLQYAMPFFEYNAFKAAGLESILPIWRKGDLALFRKTKVSNVARPKLLEKYAEWTEVEIDNVRIRVKQMDSNDNSPLKISPLIKGDILPSVSIRDKRRQEANVWTSGNRIYNVNNTKRLLHCLNSKEKNIGDKDGVRFFINKITKLENMEYSNYLEWLNNEMEK